jgi:hypothetical protein
MIDQTINELSALFLDPTLVLCVAFVSSVLLMLCAVAGAGMRKEIEDLRKQLYDRKVELGYVEKKLKLLKGYVLYNNYKDFDDEVPLGLLPGKVLRGYKEPSFANTLRFATAVAEDPDAINELTAVLETERGAFVRTLEMEAHREFNLSDDGLTLTAHWLPIQCGQPCKADLYIVFRDLILRHVDYSIWLVPGDTLNVHYTLNPSDLG